MKWLTVLRVIGPAALAGVPGAAPFIPLVLAGIETAERSGKSGAEKKQIAKEAIRIGAEAAVIASKGKAKIDPAKAVQVADDVIDAVVGSTNLIAALTPDQDPVGPGGPAAAPAPIE